jgi:hypothetical protein
MAENNGGNRHNSIRFEDSFAAIKAQSWWKVLKDMSGRTDADTVTVDSGLHLQKKMRMMNLVWGTGDLSASDEGLLTRNTAENSALNFENNKIQMCAITGRVLVNQVETGGMPYECARVNGWLEEVLFDHLPRTPRRNGGIDKLRVVHTK